MSFPTIRCLSPYFGRALLVVEQGKSDSFQQQGRHHRCFLPRRHQHLHMQQLSTGGLIEAIENSEVNLKRLLLP